MKTWFSYDPYGDGFVTHETEAEARTAAEKALEAERDNAHEGWSDVVEDICWGKIQGQVIESERRPAEEGENFDEFVDYALVDVADIRPINRVVNQPEGFTPYETSGSRGEPETPA